MKTKNLLILLLTFLSLGALGGGGLLILSPSGNMLGTPPSMLDASPFDTFLIPGILLFTFIGLAPLFVVVGLIKKPESSLAEYFNAFKDMHWSWSYTIYVSFVLIVWIQIQEILINGVHFLHTFYMAWALLILFVCLSPGVRRQYLKSYLKSKRTSNAV